MAVEVEFLVTHEADAQVVASTVRATVLGWGLERTLAVRAATVAAELASNMVFHGGGKGRLVLRRDLCASKILLSAEDQGPGMSDPLTLFELRIGHSSRGLGIGGGAIRRLSDHCEACTPPQGGLRVLAEWRCPA